MRDVCLVWTTVLKGMISRETGGDRGCASSCVQCRKPRRRKAHWPPGRAITRQRKNSDCSARQSRAAAAGTMTGTVDRADFGMLVSHSWSAPCALRNGVFRGSGSRPGESLPDRRSRRRPAGQAANRMRATTQWLAIGAYLSIASDGPETETFTKSQLTCIPPGLNLQRMCNMQPGLPSGAGWRLLSKRQFRCAMARRCELLC